MVIWIIGLSNSGKTTLAKNVYRTAKCKGITNIVHLDGDEMRKLYGDNLGHDVSSRRTNSNRIQNFCRLLDSQEIHVICSILSIFPDARDWCRKTLSGFTEVYLECPISELVKRDTRGIYSNNNGKEIAGLTLDFPIPEQPDLKISNSGSLAELLSHTESIVNLLKD